MKRHVINSPHPFVTFLWHFLVQLSHCENLVLHLDSGSFWSTTLKIGCLWRWFTNTLSWTGQNYTVVTFKPSLQLLVSESRSTQFLLTAAFCSSFPHSLPPMHQFVKLTMACHFRTCQNSSLHLLPLWIRHSSSLSVLLSSLPCLSAAACLFLSAYLLCDRYIFWIFSHACMKSCVCFWVTPYFQDMDCNDILEKPILKDILWNTEVAILMENDMGTTDVLLVHNCLKIMCFHARL